MTILGGTMALLALTSTATALSRWVAAHRVLAKRDAAAPPRAPEPEPVREPISDRPISGEIFAPVPKALRESAELPL
jgi:hypothetical protein